MLQSRKFLETELVGEETVEGESIENKMERITTNKEPIKDGAPRIYTERKEGVIAAYNIRTDRFEIAAEAMDKVQASIQAKRDARAQEFTILEGGNGENPSGENQNGTESM